MNDHPQTNYDEMDGPLLQLMVHPGISLYCRGRYLFLLLESLYIHKRVAISVALSIFPQTVCSVIDFLYYSYRTYVLYITY